MEKTVGYILLVLSFFAWGLIAIVLLMDLSFAMMTTWTAGQAIWPSPKQKNSLLQSLRTKRLSDESIADTTQSLFL